MLSKNTIKRITQLQQKKYRKQTGLFIVEGEKMVIELIQSTYEIDSVFGTAEFMSKYKSLLSKLPVHEITTDELNKISQLKTPNQALALAKLPQHSTTSVLQNGDFYLALDNIQDPGNLGTIIRTANWFGVRTIFCSEDTVDAFNPKVVQSTMGALFSTNLIYTPLSPLLEMAKEKKIPIFATSLSGTNIYHQQFKETGLIVMGNESKGVSNEISMQVDQNIKIPAFNPNPIESLNVAVAASIVLAEIRRPR